MSRIEPDAVLTDADLYRGHFSMLEIQSVLMPTDYKEST